MATLTAQDVSTAGLKATYAAASSGGDVVANDGNIILHVKNGDASSHTVTTTAQVTSKEFEGFGSATFSNSAVSIAAGGEKFIGPFPIKTFNNTAGNIAITYDAVTSVTIAAIKVD